MADGVGDAESSASPTDIVIARSEGDALRASLRLLPEAQAEVITLAYYAG